LGASMGSTLFFELLVFEALHENLGVIFSFPMLVDLHVAFAMLSLCYAWHPGF
jgi:hypothetical protein